MSRVQRIMGFAIGAKYIEKAFDHNAKTGVFLHYFSVFLMFAINHLFFENRSKR